MTQQIKKVYWALARITFIVYIAFSVVTLVGGFLTAPLMTWYFFGDWRFWRYWAQGKGLLPHGYRLLKIMFRDNQSFLLGVPLTTPPRTSPDPKAATPHPNWLHGESCGNCSNCCRAGGYACPLLDEKSGLCSGYDSFYWRYFNCGRFPAALAQIDYYDCRKWIVTPIDGPHPLPVEAGVSYTVGATGGAARSQTPDKKHEQQVSAAMESLPAETTQPGSRAATRSGTMG